MPCFATEEYENMHFKWILNGNSQTAEKDCRLFYSHCNAPNLSNFAATRERLRATGSFSKILQKGSDHRPLPHCYRLRTFQVSFYAYKQ